MDPNRTIALNGNPIPRCATMYRSTRRYILIPAILLLLSLSSMAQCIMPSMVFANPTLVSGSSGQIGAIYRFANVTPGIDCTIQVVNLAGGAQLNQMDATVQGYYNAWQPYVTAGGSGTSYLDWKIQFKIGGTNTNAILPCLAITAVDVDGDGSKLKEFIVASTPGAFAVDPNTVLNVSFDGVNSKAVGTVITVPNIDTAARKNMFQMNFANVSTIYYRNGSISTKAQDDVRHTCIYFKSFFDEGLMILPMKLLSFTANNTVDGIQLNWKATSEKDIQAYTVQKSNNGTDWQGIGTVPVPQDGANAHQYAFNDKAIALSKVHYRLEYKDPRGVPNYSRVFTTDRTNGALTISCPTIVSKSIPIQLSAANAETYRFALFNMHGQPIRQQQYAANAGANYWQFDIPSHTGIGSYMLAVSNTKGEVVYRTKLVVQ
jgi:hypothetical protein